jgi:hypothetical protein
MVRSRRMNLAPGHLAPQRVVMPARPAKPVQPVQPAHADTIAHVRRADA